MTSIEMIDDWLDRGTAILKNRDTISKDIETLPPRVFKGQELAKLLGLSSVNTVYKAEERGLLNKPDRQSRSQGYVLEEVLERMDHFNALPWREPEEPPIYLSVTNFKGGCWKTAIAWNLATYLANQGYRVLLNDLDPQATISDFMGFMPDYDVGYEDGIGPYLLNDPDFPIERFSETAIHKTRIPTLDIIPGCLDLASVESTLTSELVRYLHAGESEQVMAMYQRVGQVLSHVDRNYDFVISDGTPSLGVLPMNLILSSDIALVPIPCEVPDFSSSLRFLEMLKDYIVSFTDNLDITPYLPQLAFLPTKFNPGKHTKGSEVVLNDIRHTFTDTGLKTVIKRHDSVTHTLNYVKRTVFEVNPKDVDVPRDALKKAVMNYSAAFEEILETLIYPRWPSKKAILEDMGVY
ncbi:AAA family ATPase [Pseudomaricurvus alkylphenolicus]|jgi:chromosome partitioning protein|uniref:AAA family ATPase n=1 Tax=Pseudomaricurvus alkylphenolicus TaxID=1306991 RepID=UPI0014229819|nr:AAA family ATPase [Pseudomaricurvus alkylphenolicus]NIB38653.1 AAA family ATPase [Pseudomaricurvus alkylphenolicus]